MSTAKAIISDAFLAAGIGDQYNAPDDASMQIGLRTFNRLLDQWSNQSLVVFNTSTDSFVMTAGQAAYSTSLLVARPTEVLFTFVRQAGVDYTVTLIGAEDYAGIGYKGTIGLPYQCWFNSGMPQGTLTYFPVPSTAYEAHVGYRAPLTSIATLTQQLSLPPGYETALVYGIATMLCPLFGTEPTPTCIYHAKSSKEAIKPQNETLDESKLAIPLGRGIFNIFMGN